MFETHLWQHVIPNKPLYFVQVQQHKNMVKVLGDFLDNFV